MSEVLGSNLSTAQKKSNTHARITERPSGTKRKHEFKEKTSFILNIKMYYFYVSHSNQNYNVKAVDSYISLLSPAFFH